MHGDLAFSMGGLVALQRRSRRGSRSPGARGQRYALADGVQCQRWAAWPGVAPSKSASKYNMVTRDANHPFAHAWSATETYVRLRNGSEVHVPSLPESGLRLPEPGHADWKRILNQFYEEHNPNKLGHVETLRQFYEGHNPNKLGHVETLRRKYYMDEKALYEALLWKYVLCSSSSTANSRPASSRLGPNQVLDAHHCRICGRTGHWGNECPEIQPYQKQSQKQRCTACCAGAAPTGERASPASPA